METSQHRDEHGIFFTAGSNIKKIKQHLCSLGQSSPRMLFMTLLVVSTYRTCWRAAYSISSEHLPCETNITSPPQPSVTWLHWWVFHHSHRSACHSFLHPAVLNTCSFSPLLWENRDNREGSFLSLMHPVSPRLACEKGFCCIGGICWSEAEVALCAQGGLIWDKHPEASTPARSTHSQPVLCHPQDPEASRSLRALR